jgi:hypothetical protein
MPFIECIVVSSRAKTPAMPQPAALNATAIIGSSKGSVL